MKVKIIYFINEYFEQTDCKGAEEQQRKERDTPQVPSMHPSMTPFTAAAAAVLTAALVLHSAPATDAQASESQPQQVENQFRPPLYNITASNLFDAGRQHGAMAKERIVAWYATKELTCADPLCGRVLAVCRPRQLPYADPMLTLC